MTMILNNKKADKNSLNARTSSTRRRSSDRRKKLSTLLLRLDRRKIEDRRIIKDRRKSKAKKNAFLISDKGLSIIDLVKEQNKTIAYIQSLITYNQSNSYVTLMQNLKNIHLSLKSQISKEEALQHWYIEAYPKNKNSQLISMANFMLAKDAEDIIHIVDIYLTSNAFNIQIEAFTFDMIHSYQALQECLETKEKYIYPCYRNDLNLQ
ncbi:MAG: hypothetical protein V3V19_09895 [Cocleimonas sp.]